MFHHSYYRSGAISYGGKRHLLLDSWAQVPSAPESYPRHYMVCGCPNSANGAGNNRAFEVSNDLDHVTCKAGRTGVDALKDGWVAPNKFA